MFEVLRRVAGLNVTASRFIGFDLDDVGPQFRIAAQRIHHNAITFGLFWMPWAGVVRLENGMMNYGGGHFEVAQTLVCEDRPRSVLGWKTGGYHRLKAAPLKQNLYC